MPETYLGRVVRHVRNRDFSPQTIMRGVKQGVEQLRLLHTRDGNLQLNEVYNNFLGIENLKVSDYSLQYLRGLTFSHHAVPIRLYDFPPDIKIELYVENKNYILTKDYLSGIPNAVGSFTGPTFLKEGLPNNGFYKEDESDQVNFEDTNPSGQRRGAFGLTKKGKLVLMDDKTKWDIIRNGFRGYKALIGTPFYFSSDDPINDRILFEPEWRRALSYLFQYQTLDGSTKTGFTLSKGSVSRVTMKKVLDHYMKSVKGNNYFAVEMEYHNADCIIRGIDGEVDDFSGGGGFYRRDHYVLMPKSH